MGGLVEEPEARIPKFGGEERAEEVISLVAAREKIRVQKAMKKKEAKKEERQKWRDATY